MAPTQWDRHVLAAVDRTTGEVTELPVPTRKPPAPYQLGGRFSQVSNRRTLAMIRTGSGMTDKDIIVFLFFALAQEDDGQHGMYVNMTFNEIGEELGMHRGAVGRIVKKLAGHRLLLDVWRRGRTVYYRATPHIIFSGPGHEQREAASAYNLPTLPGMEDPTLKAVEEPGEQ